ncbi:hypothetical protein JCM10207_004099, partial [Rhodosporidiobolus poonsookiae]
MPRRSGRLSMSSTVADDPAAPSSRRETVIIIDSSSDQEDASPAEARLTRSGQSFGGRVERSLERAPLKKGTGKAKKREAPPSKFDLLPLETVGDIFCQLDLEGVFTLSRLSKRLYRFLRKPSSSYIWETACKNVGMPELTAPGWTLPGLANLCYGCCQ